jgi:uncharacterized membrane-anchored protein
MWVGQMHPNSLPIINLRYWLIILVASMCGTTIGDLLSQTLNLGFLGGPLILAVLFLVVLCGEHMSRFGGEIYYWLAIVVARAAATDLADFATHQLKLDYLLVAGGLVALLIVVLIGGRAAGATTIEYEERPDGYHNNIPVPNVTYWAAMVAAGLLGTVSGDFVSGDLGLGVGHGTVVLTAITACFMLACLLEDRVSKAWYWLTVVAVRTAGTDIGDYLSADDGLNLGFTLTSLCLGMVLVTMVLAWKDRRVPELSNA